MRRIVSAHWNLGVLLLILVLAGILRLAKLDQVPPGLHVDEAANAWNAYTLLKTGMDQHGVRWPVFYTRAFGENRSVSYVYALLPFQALGGMNVWTTRLPSAVGGILTVLLIYFVGARLFGNNTGLVAAAMLAISPWHAQISRLGLEASLSPLLIIGSLAVFLWADMPLASDVERRPKPWASALAGIVVAGACYGYWALRLFLPLFFIGAALLTWKGWWKHLKSRDGALSIGAMLIAGGVIFGPLFWMHLTDPEIGRRARIQGWVWSESDTPTEKIEKALSRYPGHFGIDFLFARGDRDPAYSLPEGTGLVHWYDLPLMLVGLVLLGLRCKESPAARVVLWWVALYPIADLFNKAVGLHSLRSLPGVGALVLVAAVGAVGAGRWLWQRRRTTAPICYALIVLAVFLNVRFLRTFFGEEFYQQKYYVTVYGADMLEVAEWLKPRLKQVDAVFVRGTGVAHPYIFTLVGLSYDPEQWSRDVREIVPGPMPDGAYHFEDVYLRYGKIHFMFGDSSAAALKQLKENGRPDRVIFIVRPVEFELEKLVRPVYEVRDMEGRIVLQIFDAYL